MSDWIDDGEVRMAVVRLLNAKGYAVENTASGSGVPRFSRIKIAKGGETLSCAIKVTTGGRISFTRGANGSYYVLSDVDRVIHAQRSEEEPAKVVVTMFDKDTVVAAFEANHAAKAAHGMEHIPSWVNPEFEEGWRLTGSGFGEKALWSETISASADKQEREVNEASPDRRAPSNDASFMETIKARLAERMGVSADKIDIEIKVRV
ncbi:hypothetical protein [Bosea sp. CS1GBMeth4]|uniref:hypothetical protein n=1 Tax=Bosea sp. CS1GBMeth4 TaxID=1892849 RepID=UPI001646C1A3|nr:hypothetical protein [Bosea sp. CS1GBMeth4]